MSNKYRLLWWREREEKERMQEVLYSRQQALIQRTLEDVRYSYTYRTYCCIRLLYLPGFYSQIFRSALFYNVLFWHSLFLFIQIMMFSTNCKGILQFTHHWYLSFFFPLSFSQLIFQVLYNIVVHNHLIYPS